MDIPSDSVPGRMYCVDPVRGTCNCPATRTCKHIRKARLMTQVDHASLAEAFVAAQADVKSAIRDSTNPHFRNTYADLGSVWEACRAALMSHGLAVMQLPGAFNNGCASLTTRLIHKGGESTEETMSIPVVKSDPQGVGSALTYMRRYALAALMGVIQEDDDGNSASMGSPTEREEYATRQRQNGTPQQATPTATTGVRPLETDEENAILAACDGNPLLVGRVLKTSVNKENWKPLVVRYLTETGIDATQFANAIEAARSK